MYRGWVAYLGNRNLYYRVSCRGSCICVNILNKCIGNRGGSRGPGARAPIRRSCPPGASQIKFATDDYFNNCVFTSIASLPQGKKLANVPSLQ